MPWKGCKSKSIFFSIEHTKHHHAAFNEIVYQITNVMQSSKMSQNSQIWFKDTDNFFVFLLFLQPLKILFLESQLPNHHGVSTKLKLK